MHSRKQQGIGNNPERPPEVTLEHPVKEKTKDELLGDGRDRYGQNNNQNALLQRARLVKKIDNSLFARAGAVGALRDPIRPREQRISREKKNDAGAERTAKAHCRESA